MLATKLQANCAAILLDKAVNVCQRIPEKFEGDICAWACAIRISSQARQGLQAASEIAVDAHRHWIAVHARKVACLAEILRAAEQ
jgi:hypothetical protein